MSLAEWLIISVDHPTASLLCKDPSIRGATAQCMRTVFALARNEQFRSAAEQEEAELLDNSGPLEETVGRLLQLLDEAPANS